MGLSIVDYSTGTTCALGLLAGILEARRTGKGRDLDVSLYDVAMHLLNYPAAWYLNNGLVTERVARSAHPFIAPSQLYRTQDGWIFIMAQTQGFWEKLADALGRGELKAKYPDFAARREHRDALTRILDGEFSKRTTEDWLKQLRGTIPCAPVYDLPQALENPYFLGRGGVQVFDHPDKPGFRLVASPFRLDEPLPAKPAPRLGEHSEALLAELGYAQADIARLKAQGTVG
jgi:crotonobetainyl-CoA:carnitine CoA-transferase CaiB-like acyl-CoA transferase